MEYLNSPFGLLLALGVIALIIVVIIYFQQRSKTAIGTGASVVETETEVIEKTEQLVEQNANALRAYLDPYRNDQPLFMHEVSNFLECVKSKSEIKVLRAVLAQLEVKSELLSKIDDFEENLHTLKRKPENFKQRDTLQDLNYDKERRRILNEIENLVDEAGGIEKARKREYENLESKLTHEYAIKSLRDDLAENADAEKRFSKNRQLDDMISMFGKQSEGINQNHNLTPSARKEALRTLEQTFIAQLDEFRRSI